MHSDTNSVVTVGE